ncbi:Secreted protein OS=Cellulomonas persica OX=76861 GN=CPE01_09060 PE=4 SV=1 [Cellulomonas persica]
MLARPGEPTAQDPSVPTRERAWVASVAPTPDDVSHESVLALPDRARGTLVLGAVARSAELDREGVAAADVRLLGSDGEVVVEERVELPVGRSVALTLADLAPEGTRLTGVQVVPDESRAWLAAGLVAQVARGDGVLLSVLVPVPGEVGTTATTVREDPRLGTR